MQINDQIREEAIFILQCCSSNVETTGRVMRDLDLSPDAEALACEAFNACWGNVDMNGQNTLLQAESLLRDGWSPGDPIYRLNETE